MLIIPLENSVDISATAPDINMNQRINGNDSPRAEIDRNYGGKKLRSRVFERGCFFIYFFFRKKSILVDCKVDTFAPLFIFPTEYRIFL